MPSPSRNPFAAPKADHDKLDKRALWRCEDLAELRALVDADRREEAAQLLKQLSLGQFLHSGQNRELGELCMRLGYTVLAGHLWYLEEHKTPEMQAACREFERSRGENPLLIANSFAGFIAPSNSYPQRRLQELFSQAEAIRSRDKELGRAAKRWKAFVLDKGCLLICAVAVIVFVIGLVTIGALSFALFFGADAWRW